MELSSEQKAAVGRWIEEGEGLSEVQRRIHDEFGVQMTYMEVRFLVLDIGAKVKDKEEPKPLDAPIGGGRGRGMEPAGQDMEPPEVFPPEEAARGAGPAGQDEGDDFPEEEGVAPEDGAPAASKVTVELDKVVRAGAAMSGTVTFSDGVTGNWILDAYGRLGLTKVSQPGYQPSAADLNAFQMRLQEILSGYR